MLEQIRGESLARRVGVEVTDIDDVGGARGRSRLGLRRGLERIREVAPQVAEVRVAQRPVGAEQVLLEARDGLALSCENAGGAGERKGRSRRQRSVPPRVPSPPGLVESVPPFIPSRKLRMASPSPRPASPSRRPPNRMTRRKAMMRISVQPIEPMRSPS